MKDKCWYCFSQIAVKPRFIIYRYLVTHEKATVSELVNILELRQPTVSFHLKQLAAAKMIIQRKQGREVFNTLNLNCPNCPLLGT